MRTLAIALLVAPWAEAQSTIYSWHADKPAEIFGQVSRAGDVDLDGHEDVIVGSPNTNEARIFSGRTGLLLHTLRPATPSS